MSLLSSDAPHPDRPSITGSVAILFGIAYWPIEALIHSFLFESNSSLFQALFSPGLNEIWMRSLISSSFIALGLFVNRAASRQQRLIRQLRQQERRSRRVIETALDAYISINADGLVTDWNPQAEKLFGWRRNEVLDRPLDDFLIPERFREAHRRGMTRYLETSGGAWLYKTVQTFASHSDGNEVAIEMAIIPLESDGSREFYTFIRLARPTSSETD